MISKANNLNFLIKLSLFTIGLISLNSCSKINQSEKPEISTDYQSCLNRLKDAEKVSFELDSFVHAEFFDDSTNLFLNYHNVGSLSDSTAITVFHKTANIVQVNLLYKGKTKWLIQDSIFIDSTSFSPGMFYPVFKDFNNDKSNDVLLIFAQSMGVCWDYGYLIIVDPKTRKLNWIKNSFSIPNLEIIKNKITSKTWSRSQLKFDHYSITKHYQIANDSLNEVFSKIKYAKGSGPRMFELITEYFDSNLIIPQIDTIGKYSLGRVESIKLAGHKIEWQSDSITNQLQIWVNENALNPDGSFTLNNVSGGTTQRVNFPKQITDIKYYKINGNDYFGFALTFIPCTGMGCGVSYFMLYDITNSRSNYFGSFRGFFDWEFRLYNFKNSPQINFLSQEYFGDNHNGLDSLKWNIFYLSNTGEMILDTNNHITHHYYEDDLFGGYQNIKWFEEIAPSASY